MTYSATSTTAASADENRRLGRLGEGLAVAYLGGRGWLIMDRNWRCRWGELDIVGMDSGDLVVCEVKTRLSRRTGAALESVTPRKLKRLHRLAELWLEERGGRPERIRIDAIGVEFERDGSYSIEHVRGAL